MIAAAGWAVWLAVGLGVANVIVWVAVVAGVRGLIRRYKPALEPLVAMFAMTSNGEPSSGVDTNEEEAT